MPDFILDDTGNGRRPGSDPHAIVRTSPPFRYPSSVIQIGNVSIAVHSYLDVRLTEPEIYDLVSDFVSEITANIAQ